MTSSGSINHAKLRDAVNDMLLALGYDTSREGLAGTPTRVARFLSSFCVPEHFSFTTFNGEGANEMVVQSGIEFYSLCEHHMLPFVGTATVAYIPRNRIVGLSKLARAVRYCSAGLQNQERVTVSIADLLEKQLDPLAVGVIIKARHMCMEMRGVKVAGAQTTTSCVRRAFADDGRARSEFLRLADTR